MVNGITSASLGAPQHALALSQHQRYCEALARAGVMTIELPTNEAFPDCCFVEDTVVIVDRFAVITNPGHPSRKGEQVAMEQHLRSCSHFEIRKIEPPGTLDGGDVLRVGENFFIGLNDRTNEQGANQLADVVRIAGCTPVLVPLPHGLLHLKTGITRVGKNAVVCVEQLANDPHFEHISDKLVVDATENVGANCLLVRDTVLVPAQCTKLQDQLVALGMKVLSMEMSEFQKLDGGLTCLSVLL